MFATERLDVFIYDGTNSTEILDYMLEKFSFLAPNWRIDEEDEEGVVFTDFSSPYEDITYPKIATGSYLVMNPRNGNITTLTSQRFIDWYVVLPE